VNWDQQQQPYVALGFKSRGAQVFCQVTTDNVGKRFAIILDEEIRSTPVIRDRICGGNASIEMGASMNALQDANTLSLVLRTGSLNAPVSVGEVRVMGATLGRDAIRQGTVAAIIGACLVFIYMALWYRLSGIIANIALGMNVLVMMAILAMFGATLTLPGIAGIALTVGMAVDANIIIYERIREELRLGVHARKAVDAGFEKAFSAIMDSNITTAIAGVVLYSYGTGPIKGFAVAMNIGIVTTLITALFVSRTLMELITRSSQARLSI
jgi:preprotein translocase subunit SecD